MVNQIEEIVEGVIEQMNVDDKEAFNREIWREGIGDQLAYTEHDSRDQVEWILQEIEWRLEAG